MEIAPVFEKKHPAPKRLETGLKFWLKKPKCRGEGRFQGSQRDWLMAPNALHSRLQQARELVK